MDKKEFSTGYILLQRGSKDTLSFIAKDNDISPNAFFTEVSEVICFSDCSDSEVVTILFNGQNLRYRGWAPGMLFEFEDNNGDVVWSGRFPEWDH